MKLVQSPNTNNNFKPTEYVFPFEGIQLLAVKLMDLSEGTIQMDTRHFDAYMSEDELTIFWKDLENYSQLYIPKSTESPKEVAYPCEFTAFNGITLTLHKQ